MSILSMKNQYDSSRPFAFSESDRSSFALIRHLYSFEEEVNQDRSSKVVSISFPADEAILLSHIAKRFGMSLSAFLNRFLDGMARDSFLALEKEDRLTIGKQTDIDLLQYEKEKGLSFFTLENGWEARAKLFNGIEQKELDNSIRDHEEQLQHQATLANALKNGAIISEDDKEVK